MPVTITLDMNDTYTKKTLKVENESLVKTIFPNYEDCGITEKQYNSLLKVASLSGKRDVLEISDLGMLHMAESSKKGNLEYVEASIGKSLLGALVGDGWVYGDKVIVRGLDKKMTLGQAEEYFGLPKGALRFNYINPRTDYRNQLCPNGTITFLAEDFPGGKEVVKQFCKIR